MKKLLIRKSMMLTGNDAGIGNLIARIHNTHIKKSFRRREAVIITNLDNHESIIRYVMGGGDLFEGMPVESVAVDYDGYDTLGLPYSKDKPIDCNLEVRRATTIEKYAFFWRHPDLSVQLSIRLALLGAMLGVCGLIISIISFF